MRFLPQLSRSTRRVSAAAVVAAAGCTQADVARTRLLLGMARAQGMRDAFVRACAEGDVKALMRVKES